MYNDDILQEIRQTREAFAAKHNYDIHAMVAELRRLDEIEQRPVVSLPPRTVVHPVVTALQSETK